ncbi:MAG: hypothetical protein JWP31_511 [Aeromicrobium sp.]|nr:hypothetical protein [Aeromicrobium sp.]
MTRLGLIATPLLAVLLLTGCSGSDEPEPPDEPTTSRGGPTATSPTPTTTATVAPSSEPDGKLLDYEGGEEGGATLTEPKDVSKLAGAPEDFKAFIAQELAKERATSDDACTEKPQIYVTRLDPGGWASGGYFIPQCGGYATLWARPGGTWKQVWDGQQLTDCATLEKYDFPADVAGGTCLRGDKQVPYTAGGVDQE